MEYSPRLWQQYDDIPIARLISVNAVGRRSFNSSGMKVLFLINDAPYGSERVYNALRLGQALLKRDAATQLTIFLLGDAVLAAKAKQKTPEGYYNIERMLGRIVSGNGIMLTCGTCMDARGMADLRAHERRATQHNGHAG